VTILNALDDPQLFGSDRAAYVQLLQDHPRVLVRCPHRGRVRILADLIAVFERSDRLTGSTSARTVPCSS